MMGAIIGDIVGSIYEGEPIKTTNFSLFGNRSSYTDDTVLTVAIADAILQNTDYGRGLKLFGRKYTAGYGCRFYDWLHCAQSAPYNSWGNGSAMRVSAVGFAYDTVEDIMREAEKTALPTHNHADGIKGAQATAMAIYRARQGAGKKEIKEQITSMFGYDLERTLDEIRPSYCFDVSCQGSVPESIIAFLAADDFESTIRNAVSLGGDADTMACIAGGIAQAFYQEIPDNIIIAAQSRLPDEFIEIINKFNKQYAISYH